LLATIHWVVTQQNASSRDDVIIKTYAWNDHKRQFSERQIELGLNRLTKEKWISPIASRAVTSVVS
jgi:hypothetical protein